MIITPSQIKQIYNESKPAIPQPVHWWKMNEEFHASLVGYASGTDGNLDNPDDLYDQNDNFIPCEYSSDPDFRIDVGDYSWMAPGSASGPGKTLYGYGGVTPGTIYGTVKMYHGATDEWTRFAGAEYNGIQRIWFPKNNDHDKLGGYVDLYYLYQAWYNAFYNIDCDIYITLDGSVYKSSILPENLVVSGAGVVGYAGKGHEPVHGTSGFDGELDAPDDTYYNTVGNNFNPVLSSYGATHIHIGNHRWVIDGPTAVGPNQDLLFTDQTGSTWGTVKLSIDSGGHSWGMPGGGGLDGWCLSTYNGKHRMYFPQTGNDTQDGGYIEFYYNYQAWHAAFNENDSDIIITIDGSIYKGSVSYANLVVTGDGIIGFAGGGAGYTPVDDSGSLIVQGTGFNAVPNQEGYKGSCYYFDGSSHIDTAKGSEYFDLSSPWMYCLWFKSDLTIGGALIGGMADYTFPRLYLNTNGRLSIYWDSSGSGGWDHSGVTVAPDGSVPADSWCHAVIGWDGDYMRGYLNGESIWEFAEATACYTGGGMRIGACNNVSVNPFYWVAAHIQDVRWYNRFPSASQIKDIYNNTERHHS